MNIFVGSTPRRRNSFSLSEVSEGEEDEDEDEEAGEMERGEGGKKPTA